MLEEQGQTPVAHSEVKQSITGTSNDTDIHIRGASRGDTENRQQTNLRNQRRKASIHL